MRPVPVRPVDTGSPPTRLYAGFVALLAALLVGSFVPMAHAAAAPDHRRPPVAIKPSWPGNTPNTTGGKDHFIDATRGRDSAAGTSPNTAWRTLAKANATTRAGNSCGCAPVTSTAGMSTSATTTPRASVRARSSSPTPRT